MSNEKVYATDSYWIGSPEGGSSDEDDRLIKDNRDKVEVLSEVSDPDLSYEYDDTAICYLKGHGYFIIQASGCSCSSSSETWGVTKRFARKSQVLKAVEDGEYDGFTLPSYAIEQFRKDLLDETVH